MKGTLAAAALVILMWVSLAHAQFSDNFDGNELVGDTSGVNGWAYFTGDGDATMTFSESGNGYASISVDATKDRRGIWWALIKRRVSEKLDLGLLAKPNYELRIEAKIKVSDAPKRVNLSFNTNRTTDFHSNLMEFDIPDTADWHTVSMTTHDFDAAPGDTVYAQLALMDWGLEKYRVDIDYFKVAIVNTDTVGPDMGVQVPYHPPVRRASEFSNKILAAQGAMIDLDYPDMNFGNWIACDVGAAARVMTISGTQFVILRWDLSRFKGKKVDGSGLLELTTYSLQRSPDYQKDFGMIRVVEITGGNPRWDEASVTCDAFCAGSPLKSVLNSQMIIDIEVNPNRGGKNFITIPNPVLQRMVDGRTLGIALKPLGAVNASFFDRHELSEGAGPVLYLNLVPATEGPE
jgi:hypothetical protein